LGQVLRIQKKSLHKWDSFATVVTGATEISSLIIDHYRGLPPIFVGKVDLQRSLESEHPGKFLRLGRILFLNPFDIRYEAVAGTATTQQKISESSYAIHIKTKSIKKITILKEKIQKSAVRKIHKRNLMSPEERGLHNKGIEEREKENILKWQKYKK